MKRSLKKLSLSRETLRSLEEGQLRRVGGAATQQVDCSFIVTGCATHHVDCSFIVTGCA
jgi:transcriptional regulator with GAF, ATPase, and Fis domain